MSRRNAALVAALIIVVGIVLATVLKSQRQPPQRRERPATAMRIEALAVDPGEVRTTLLLTGPLRALDRVDVYAEVSGLLVETPMRFLPGTYFRKGETLIRIDDAVYRNNVLAQKSSLLNTLTLLLPDLSIDFPESEPRWRDYLAGFVLDRPLAPLPEPGSETERYYIASRNIYTQFYTVKSMEATLDKYTINAPYDGIVTDAAINPGTLVRQGQMLGSFVSTAVYEMEAFADIDEVRLLETGMPVVLTTRDLPGEFAGSISRINESIDASTQLIGVYVTTTDGRLRDGLYMTARIESMPIAGAVRIPRSALVDDHTVWVARDSVLSRETVEVALLEDKHAIVRGLDGDLLVVDSPPEEIEEGMRIPAPAPARQPAAKVRGSGGH
ncbi:MAG: HlyD family efflux transporter periplasmic adaptor subunit [Candidatus Krumholzibacteriota bacterium]|nr:HlyD family efflux transporter periplasmic adaptor subunit [Candidatus Krumholzibacteriota bacterium]